MRPRTNLSIVTAATHEGFFTGPYLLRRPYHPQKPGSQTLGLQCAPPTPPTKDLKPEILNVEICSRTSHAASSKEQVRVSVQQGGFDDGEGRDAPVLLPPQLPKGGQVAPELVPGCTKHCILWKTRSSKKSGYAYSFPEEGRTQ